MSFTDIFIRRPVLSSVVSLILLLIGLMSYQRIPVRQFPEIQTSVIKINIFYAGASAKLMESFVSTPIENALASVEGIDYVTSENSQSNSQVSLYLRENADINTVINDVSDKVNSIRGKLPQEIEDPVIEKQDPNVDPTLFISFISKTMKPEEITNYLIREIRPEIEVVQGVAQARIFGEQEYAMRIWLNPQLMAAHNVTASEVVDILRANNIQSAPGRIEADLQEFNITAKTDLNTPDQFNRLVLKEEDGKLVRLGDVGHAELGVLNDRDRGSTIMNGQKAVVLGVVPQSTANPLDIAKAVRAILPRLKERLPPGLDVILTWDSSKFISESIREVYKTIAEACLFVILVIFLFLGSFRAVFIPAVTIPLSLFGVCSLMYALNFSINTITLLACVLSIGMVVDDAIVVLENIHRHIEEGLSPFKAALQGAREIRFAVITMTFTLAAVYAPIGFMEGLTGKLFREFAFALAGSVIISGFIALILSPMLCSKLLDHGQSSGGFSHWLDKKSDQLRVAYRSILDHALNHRGKVIITGLLVYGLCGFLWKNLPNELAPTEDQGALMGIAIGPTTANLAYTEKYTREIQKIYEQVPEKSGYVIVNGWPKGVYSSLSFLILKPWAERTRSATEIRGSLFPQMWSIPGFNAFPVELPALPGPGGRNPVDVVLKTTADYKELNRAMATLLAAAHKNPRLLNPDTDLKLNNPEIHVEIDRDKAADMGISMKDIASTLNVLLAEGKASQFAMGGRRYYVIPEIYPNLRNQPNQIEQLYLRTRSQELTQLSNIITLNRTLAPLTLEHFQQMRSAKLTASLAPGYTLGEALSYLQKEAKRLLPSFIQVDYAGQSRQFVEASGTIIQIFIFACLFIYLVLAAQFESFRDPFIVMVSVPLSLAGALLAMTWTGSSLNIYTQIGLVTLVGLITKHGILLVEFANQRQLEGAPIRTAILDAAAIRLRPILMTTAAMILGAIPLTLASGAGAASRQQMGWVIAGGMSFGTLLTLFVVPAVYTLFASEKHSRVEEAIA